MSHNWCGGLWRRVSEAADDSSFPGREHLGDSRAVLRHVRLHGGGAPVLRLGRASGLGVHARPRGTQEVGVRAIAKSTVKNILKENGLDPSGRRGKDSWGEVLKRHAATL